MKKFLELWSFEWNRAKRFYGFLLAFVTSLQAYAVFHEYHFWKDGYENYRQQGYAVMSEQYLQDFGNVTTAAVTSNSFFVFSIMTAVFALLFYSVFIWYQDWTGKNRFSLRLLSLPGNRFAVYAAKFATLWLLITGLQVWQIGLLYLEELVFSGLIPADIYLDIPLQMASTSASPLALALPSLFSNYLLYYTIGYTVLTLGYTFILMHLSGRWKGVFLSGILAVGLIAAIVLFLRTGITTHLYAEEKYWVMIALSLVLFLSGTWANYRLLEKRISV
jgi:hypothetical protein